MTATAQNLRVDGRENDGRFLALAASPRPRLSWVVPLVRDGQRQTAFRVRVGEVVDSGIVESADPWFIVAEDLPAHALLPWTVAVRDETGEWSEASAGVVETGHHELGQWSAQWLTAPAGAELFTTFTVPDDVQRARLHLTAQGLVRARVGAVAVDHHAVDPSRTDRARALVRSYDVTDLCTRGEIELSLVLGRGQWADTGLDPRVLAELVITHHDGRTSRIGTGPQWRARTSCVVVDEPFYRERHDLVHASSLLPDPVVLVPGADPDAPPACVRVDPGPAVRATGTERAQQRPHVDGVRVYAVAANTAGRVELRPTGALPAGTVVRVVHGEHLDARGRVDTTNITLPHDTGRTRQVYEVVTDGTEQVLTPWFAYYGFRFFEIEGLPEHVDVEVAVVSLHSDVRSASRLGAETAQLMHDLDDVARRTFRNTVHGVPEDCPTREQAGWTGDTSAAADFAFAAFDLEAFHRKWLGDVITSQGQDGSVPAVVPHVAGEPVPSDPVWGSALPRVLRAHWLHYGDRRVVEDTLPALRRWTAFLDACVGAEGIVDAAPISYGHDWLGLHQTPPELHHTVAAIEAWETLAEFEPNPSQALAAAARLRHAARRFMDPDTGTAANGSQGSQALALVAGLVDDDRRDDATRHLTSSVATFGNRVTSGFATTRTVVRALTEQGRDDVIHDVLCQRAEPGIGAMLAHPSRTFWECWWIDPENTGTGSLDHVGLGGPFAGWLWTAHIGVIPTSAGYATARVDPRPVPGVDAAEATISTVRGDLAVSWRRHGAELRIDVEVPVSMRVSIAGTDGEFGSGRHTVTVPCPVVSPTPADEATILIPVPAPRAADVDGVTDLLEGAIAAGAVTGVDGAVEVIDALHCMPVPHEQEAGPVIRTVGGASARVQLEGVWDVSDAAFVAVRLDTDLPNTTRPLHPVFELHAADGSVRRTAGRLWPAGWSRVAVDVAGWSGAADVRRIVIGVQTSAGADETPAAVHIAGLVVSRRPRRW